MVHFPKPWFRPSRDTWYVAVAGKPAALGLHPDDAPQPKKGRNGWNVSPVILAAYQVRMTAPEPAAAPALPTLPSDSLAALFDRFQDHVGKDRAPDTYRRYMGRPQASLRFKTDQSKIADLTVAHPTCPARDRVPAPPLRLPLLALCLSAVWLGSIAGRTEAGEKAWKAGVAKAVITPEKGVWLAGYGSKRPPDGKLHDLWMKALALEDHQGRRVVLVTSDFQGVPKEMSDRVFLRLQKRLKLERHQVMITFSHNHCGPRLGSDLVDYYPVEDEQVRLVDEYTARMETRLVETVGKALADLAPARLEVGEGHATFAVNRRNNREAEVPALRARGEAIQGPVDHAVPVLTVARPDGNVIAILFGYACHPTTLNFTKWCGDYPGFAQLALEKKHAGATALFVNTCGGDQNPLPRRTVDLCEKYGHMLADAVEDALKKPLKEVPTGLRTAFAYVDLPYEKVITRDELLTAAKDPNAIKKRWAERLLKKLDAGEKFPASYPYPLHAWRLGRETLILGMGAETVVDYALRFKATYGRGTWVCGYADDLIAYIPSRRVWAEGGYEGGPNLYEYGRPALRWSGDIEDRIAATVRQLVKSVGEDLAGHRKE